MHIDIIIDTLFNYARVYFNLIPYASRQVLLYTITVVINEPARGMHTDLTSYRDTMLTKHNIVPITFSRILLFFQRATFSRRMPEYTIWFAYTIWSPAIFTNIFRILRADQNTCERCYYRAVRSSNMDSGKEIDRSIFSVPRSYKRMHLGENVPRNAPRAQNEDDRNRDERPMRRTTHTGWEGRSADVVSKLQKKQLHPAVCRPPRVMCRDSMACDSIAPLARTRNRDTLVDSVLIVSPYCLSISPIPACRKHHSIKKHHCDGCCVTRSSKRCLFYFFFFVPAARSSKVVDFISCRNV